VASNEPDDRADEFRCDFSRCAAWSAPGRIIHHLSGVPNRVNSFVADGERRLRIAIAVDQQRPAPGLAPARTR
jgi:hypothetical protein